MQDISTHKVVLKKSKIHFRALWNPGGGGGEGGSTKVTHK
jgi:hypothetical protein